MVDVAQWVERNPWQSLACKGRKFRVIDCKSKVAGSNPVVHPAMARRAGVLGYRFLWVRIPPLFARGAPSLRPASEIPAQFLSVSPTAPFCLTYGSMV